MLITRTSSKIGTLRSYYMYAYSNSTCRNLRIEYVRMHTHLIIPVFASCFQWCEITSGYFRSSTSKIHWILLVDTNSLEIYGCYVTCTGISNLFWIYVCTDRYMHMCAQTYACDIQSMLPFKVCIWIFCLYCITAYAYMYMSLLHPYLSMVVHQYHQS